MYLDAALHAAREASNIIMKYYGNEKGLRWKGEIDPVTQADIEAEKKIVSLLKEKFPEHGFILEEADNIREQAEYVWIIDPIDGTTNFSHNHPHFCTSIALYRNHKPLVGVIYAPILNETFHAEAGRGVYLNGKKAAVSLIKTIKESLVVTGFPYSRLYSDRDNLKYFNKMAKRAGGLRRSGSAALDMCYVACGRFDAYWELDLKTVDTAAAQLILKEAGGKITNFLGEDIGNDFSMIVATNGIVHQEVLDILKEAGV